MARSTPSASMVTTALVSILKPVSQDFRRRCDTLPQIAVFASDTSSAAAIQSAGRMALLCVPLRSAARRCAVGSRRLPPRSACAGDPEY